MTKNFRKAKVPLHVSMSLHHNRHTVKRLSIAECITRQVDGYADDDWINKEQKQKALETGNHWYVEVYPKSHATYFIYAASDLDKLLSYLNKLENWPEVN